MTTSVGIGAKWDGIWARHAAGHESRMLNPEAADVAADWLSPCASVEDWGCGHGLFRRHLPAGVKWVGVDACAQSAAEVVADLTIYRSQTPGLHMRGVLEHNQAWRSILDNALASYAQRAVIVVG